MIKDRVPQKKYILPIAVIIIIVVIIVIFPCFFPCIFIPSEELTTVFIVRHAEYDINTEHLTSDGIERAETLAKELCEADVTVIYTTSLIRTQETAQPLATAKELQLNINDNIDTLVNEIKTEHVGEVILIVGHSPTVPGIINSLIEESSGYSVGDDFHNLFVVVFNSRNYKVINLQYGTTPNCTI